MVSIYCGVLLIGCYFVGSLLSYQVMMNSISLKWLIGGLSDVSKQSTLCHCGLSEERQYTCFALTFFIYYICFLQVYGAFKYTTYLVLLRNLVRCGPSDVRFYMECKNVGYCGPSVGRSYTVSLLFLLLYDLHYGGGNSYSWQVVVYVVVRWYGSSLLRSYLRLLTAYFSLAVEKWWLIAVQIWVAVGSVCMYHGDGCSKRLAMLQVGDNQWLFFLFLFYLFTGGVCSLPTPTGCVGGFMCTLVSRVTGFLSNSVDGPLLVLFFGFAWIPILCIIFILLQVPIPTGCVGRFCGCDDALPTGCVGSVLSL